MPCKEQSKEDRFEILNDILPLPYDKEEIEDLKEAAQHVQLSLPRHDG